MIDEIAKSATKSIYQRYVVGKITKEKEKRETGFVDVTDTEYPNIRSLEKQDYGDKQFGVVDFV